MDEATLMLRQREFMCVCVCVDMEFLYGHVTEMPTKCASSAHE